MRAKMSNRATLFAALCVLCLLPRCTRATSISVATFADLSAAVSNAAVDTITVTASITVTAQMTVTRTLLVQGDGVQCAAAAGLPAPVQGLCTLSGGGAVRLFEVYVSGGGAALTLNSLALVQGSDVADGKGGAAVLLLPGSSSHVTSLNASNCVFQANNASGTGPGGAVAANPSSLLTGLLSMTLSNTQFIANTAVTAAGAVLASGPTMLTNVTFTSNSASFSPLLLSSTTLQTPGSNGLGFGGALQLASCGSVPGSLTVQGGAFNNNWGAVGGAVLCGPSCTCTLGGGVSFSNNTATGAFQTGGAGVGGSGGAIAALPNSTLLVSGVTFLNNSAGNEGGAVYMTGTKQGSLANALGGLYGFSGHTGITTLTVGTSVAVASAHVQGIFTGCTLSGNSAGITGGGLYADGARALMNVSTTTISAGSAGKKGGGIYAATSSTMNVASVSVFGCSAGSAGGGIAVGGSCNLTLTSSSFTSCTSGGTGGGVYADANGAPIVLSTVFTANSALTGGGLYIDASAVLTATNLSFVSNTASAGGGALVIAANASATLQSCSFAQNSAASAGGALLGSAAASVTLAQSSFVQNFAAGIAPHGGAVALENVGLVSLASCSFTANAALTSLSNNAPVGGVEQLVYAGANSAGALFLGAASAAAGGVPMYASIADTTFTGCSASGAGGAIAALAQISRISISLSGATSFVGNTAGTSGGAFAASGAVTGTFTGVTLTGNSAQQDGGAAFLDDGTSTIFTGGAASSNVALGNGGVLRMQGTASTSIAGGTYATNSALYGGVASVSGAAHTLAISGSSSFTTNNATFGGVFSLFNVTQAVNSQLTLAGATLTANVGETGALFFSNAVVMLPACAGCTLSGNVATNYGAVSASNAAGIATAPQSFSAVSATPSVTTGTAATVNIRLLDGYGSVVGSWPLFAAALVPSASLAGVLDAGELNNGVSTISTARVSGVPGNTVPLTVVVTSPALVGATSQSVPVLVAQCGANEVYQDTMCLCDRGYFKPVGSTAACQPCAPGTYASGMGEVMCRACAASDVSLAAAQVCLPCPPASRPLTESICMCESNFYGLFNNTNNGTCTACPDNAVCQFGHVIAGPGYWHSFSTSIDIQDCPEGEACDYDGRTDVLIAMALNGTDEATLRAAQCYEAYEGPLCAMCAPGFGRDTDLKCGECPSFAENTGKLALTSFTNILSISLTVKSIATQTSGKPLHSQIIKVFLNFATVSSLASRVPLKWPKRIEELLAAQSTGTHSSGKTVAMECSMPYRDRPKFYDLVSGYLILVPFATILFPVVIWTAIYLCLSRPGAMQATRVARFSEWWNAEQASKRSAWPALAAAKKADNALPPAAADVGSSLVAADVNTAAAANEAAAAAPARHSNSFMADADELVMPQVLSKEDAKYEAHLNTLVAPRQLGNDLAGAQRKTVSFLIITFVCVIFFVWTPVTSAVLHLFVCTEVDPLTPDSPFHGTFLQQHMEEVCWAGRHLSYMLAGGMLGVIFIVLGIPIGTGVFLWRNRMRLDEPNMLFRFGFLYEGYTREACYYESIIMMRKLALVIVTVFFSHSTPAAGAYVLLIMLGVMFVSFVVHQRVKPYKAPILERLELLSMSGSVGTLWIGIFFYLGTPDEVEVILSLVLIFFNALLCLEFVLSIVMEMLRAQLVKELPAGAKESVIDEDSMSEHVIFFWWPGVVARRDGFVKTVHGWILLRFIRYMEHGRRPAQQIRQEIPETLRRMKHGAAQHEYERRAKNVAAWVDAGLITDAETAAWLCNYEARGRTPTLLDPLVADSCERAAALQLYLRAAKMGHAHVQNFEHEYDTPDAVLARSKTTPPDAKHQAKRQAPPKPKPGAATQAKAAEKRSSAVLEAAEPATTP